MPPSVRKPVVERMDPQVVASLRRTSVAERMAMMGDLNDTARILMAAGIRYCHPDWSDDQIQAEVARRMLRVAD